MTRLLVESCGPATSLQDAGRRGWQRYGVSTSGAMDRLALATANALVGNGPEIGAIEFVLVGGTFRVEGGSARLAVAGAFGRAALDGRPVPDSTTLRIEPGQVFAWGPARLGVYAYLAVAGGLAVPPQLGSVSLQRRAGIGGVDGRALRAGDRLPLAADRFPSGPDLTIDPVPLDRDAPVRVVLGPQDDHFTPDGLATFLSETYRVRPEADRMGYRLAGPRIGHARGYNIVSDGIVAGSVQIPGSGEPIVMLADRQTTGGYPKIATVISADLRVIAQRRPGEAVRFAAVEVDAAEAVARRRASALARLGGRVRPVRSGVPSEEALLRSNLAGSAVDALADHA